MSVITAATPAGAALPDHTQLPESDGAIVENFQEHPQAMLLTATIFPFLNQLHPDGQFAIGQNSGIYWRWTDPPLKGCKAPDWFYVPGVPPLLEGHFRRSYVLWQELKAPRLILEFASGDGAEELDRTPEEGKFWVYEQVIRAPYYGVWEMEQARLRVFRLVDGAYEQMQPNEHGRYLIAPLGLELGVWTGKFLNMEMPWLRWWDRDGNMLLTGEERAERLAQQLRDLGVEPKS